MPYPQDALHANETLVLDLHPHWWFFVKSVAMLVVAIVLALAAVTRDWPDVIKYAIGIALLSTLVWFLQRYVAWVSTHFVLTSDRVIYRTGIIAKRGIEIPLERINTIFFTQRIIERLFGLGDLEIESASKDGAQRFEDIRNPSAVQNEIYQQMESNEVKSAERISSGINAAQAAGPSIPEQIAQLAQLRDQGVITVDEFERKKSDLLDRM